METGVAMEPELALLPLGPVSDVDFDFGLVLEYVYSDTRS